MKDLTNPVWIKLKGVLFLLIGILSSALLLIEHPQVKIAGLLTASIWCFCRFYYFAFYVLEHYVDPTFKFSGLWAFALYFLSKKSRK